MEELRKELEPNERLLWSGAPRGGLVFRRADLLLVPLSLLWTAFVLFWITDMVAAQAPPFFLAFATLFLALALYQVAGRFFVDSWLRAVTHYGITDARVIIVATVLSRRVQSLPLAGLTDVTLIEDRGGFGAIRFGKHRALFAILQPSPEMRALLPPCFDSIADAAAAYKTFQDARRSVV